MQSALEDLLKKEAQTALLQAQADLKRAQAEIERLKGARLDKEIALARAHPDAAPDIEYIDSGAPIFYHNRQPEHLSGVSPTAPVAPPRNPTPPPTHSFSPVQVSTPTTVTTQGPGGSVTTRRR